ncbi:RhuM family protein [Wolbachia endosymbiont (group B) of Eucosma cana]|nr:RhuM family protein [Wolbachia endosymbiont (group B) of Eucosma cana]
MYLDYAELQARKHRLMKMQNWVEKLDAFLLFNDYEVLKDAGKVSAEVAKALAEGEYEKYRVVQDKLHESDFDELIKASKESEKITTTKTSL